MRNLVSRWCFLALLFVPLATGAAWAQTFTGGVPLGTFTGTPPIRGVALQPEYLIEYVRRGSSEDDFFRITARGFGYRAGTEVVMQSYFKVPPL